jgi:hypothetical protein
LNAAPASTTFSATEDHSMTIAVFRVDFYDIRNDEMQRSRRWFTREGAAKVKGLLIEDTATEIDATSLEAGEQWTVRDFDPHRVNVGFQRSVRT